MTFHIIKSAFWCASVALAVTSMNVTNVRSATMQQLHGTTGGACYGCLPQDYCELQEPCEPILAGGNPTGFFKKLVGTSITQKFCYDRESGSAPGLGFTQCTTGTPKDCVKTYTCTDAACTNCGPPGTEKKDTKCNFAGDACEVKD
jgi:hypothetical protein